MEQSRQGFRMSWKTISHTTKNPHDHSNRDYRKRNPFGIFFKDIEDGKRYNELINLHPQQFTDQHKQELNDIFKRSKGLTPEDDIESMIELERNWKAERGDWGPEEQTKSLKIKMDAAHDQGFHIDLCNNETCDIFIASHATDHKACFPSKKDCSIKWNKHVNNDHSSCTNEDCNVLYQHALWKSLDQATE